MGKSVDSADPSFRVQVAVALDESVAVDRGAFAPLLANRRSGMRSESRPGPVCRLPQPGDDERDDISRSMKSRGETVSFDEILDAWREVLCS